MPDGSSPGERWAHHSSGSEIFASEKRESRGEKACLAPSLAWRGPGAKREAKEEAGSEAEEEAKCEAEEQAGCEAEEQAKRAAEEKFKREAEEKAERAARRGTRGASEPRREER